MMLMMRIKVIAFLIPLSMAIALGSCGSSRKKNEAEKDALVTVGDSALYMSDVLRRIPAGLDTEDSIQMFHNIVDSWVDALVLTSVAERNIRDIQRIDRMVEEYRNNLIINEYLKLMSERSNPDINEQVIKDYYDKHSQDFILSQPLVKGAFVRVDENDSELPYLRKWLADFSDESFDKIERVGLRHATAYEYFGDEWHEWSEVADRIPYRFFDADAFVSSTADFETSTDGSVYILHISDHILSGNVMPYEYARLKIAEMMRVAEINTSRSRLKADIYKRMIKDGTLRPGLYDPVKGEMKSGARFRAEENVK